MKISQINNYAFNYKNNNSLTKSKTNQKTVTSPAFKGDFLELSQFEDSYNRKPVIIDGRIYTYKQTRKPVGFDYIRYAYVAAPGEKDEDIQQRFINLTICTIHTEMPFSWIRYNYRNGYKNVANNAYREKKFFAEKIKTENEKLDTLYENKQQFKDIYTHYKLKISNDFEKLVNSKLPGRLERFDKVIDEQKEKIEGIKKQKEISDKRFELLCELDELGGQKQSMIDEQARIHGRKSEIERILPEKYGNEYDTLNAERQILENHLTQMDKDFAKIDEKLDNSFHKIENFYEEYYPELYKQ